MVDKNADNTVQPAARSGPRLPLRSSEAADVFGVWCISRPRSRSPAPTTNSEPGEGVVRACSQAIAVLGDRLRAHVTFYLHIQARPCFDKNVTQVGHLVRPRGLREILLWTSMIEVGRASHRIRQACSPRHNLRFTAVCQ